MGIGDRAGKVQSEGEVRRVPVPTRSFGRGLIVARPRDGAPVVLPATAAAVLTVADDWKSTSVIDLALAEHFPTVDVNDRQKALEEVLDRLTDEGLLERR